MLDLAIQDDLAGVPVPSIGRVMFFAGADGNIMARQSNGSVVGAMAGSNGTNGTDGVDGAAVSQVVADNAAASAGQAESWAGQSQTFAGQSETYKGQAETFANQAIAAAIEVANRFDTAGVQSLNAGRVGVVAGLLVHTLDKGASLVGKVVRCSGSLRLVSTAIGTCAMSLNIGGLIVPFLTVPTTATTQIYNYDVSVMVISAAVGAGSIKHAIAASGVSATLLQASNAAVSGSAAGTVIDVSVKTPVTSTITVLSSVVEVI